MTGAASLPSRPMTPPACTNLQPLLVFRHPVDRYRTTSLTGGETAKIADCTVFRPVVERLKSGGPGSPSSHDIFSKESLSTRNRIRSPLAGSMYWTVHA